MPTCSIPEIKRNDIDQATRLFVGNSTTWVVRAPGVIEMPTTMKFKSVNQLFQIAQANMKRIEKWAGSEEKYGPEFARGWLDRIDQQYSSHIVVYLKFPQRLELALQVKDEVMTMEEANKELVTPNVGTDFFMGDELLMEQDRKEFEEFSNISSQRLDELMNKKREC